MRSATKGRVVVAMSGGVDSSVAAALLNEEGYDVVGITLQLYDHGAATGRKGACCAGQDIHDAARVADVIGIPHYVLDYETKFHNAVVVDLADAYLRGETPIPCVNCNERVKFRDLLATARDLEAMALATGHYVQRVDGIAGPELHRAVDASRDQSYFLHRTTRNELEFLRFPLGGLTKDRTRELARRYKLPVAAKPDSQDICFVTGGSYADVVIKLRPGAIEPGDIVDGDGNILGRHDGIIHFTVGQRKGIGIAATEPLYVLRLEPATRRVVVGPRRALARERVSLHSVNWLGAMPPPSGMSVAVKLRSAQAPMPARLFLDGTHGEVRLDAPAYGVAPGQACVFYDGARCLGGGWIGRADTLGLTDDGAITNIAIPSVRQNSVCSD